MTRVSRVLSAAVVLLGGVATTGPASGAALPSSSCAEVIVYVVRGSGEAPQTGAGAKPYDPANPTAGYADTWDAFDPIDDETTSSSILAGRILERSGSDKEPRYTPGTGTPFLYDLVQKIHERAGSQVRLSWSPIRYPAVPVARSWFTQPWWLYKGYPDSVTSGIRELHRTLRRQWELCGTSTRYVLAGYSQGADVVSSYLRGKILTRTYRTPVGTLKTRDFLGPSRQIRGQIAAVSLVADPNHDPQDPESYSHLDSALADKGGLTGFRSGVPRDLVDATDSLCLRDDPVCGQGTRKPELGEKELIHTVGYRDADRWPVRCLVDGERTVDEDAVSCLADRVVMRLEVRNLAKHPLERETAGTTGRDVAFFVDTTGSMQDDIDAALSFARNQADRVVALDGRVALVEYRDSGDALPAQVVTPFTNDLTEFQNGLSSLDADGGDDTPEGLLHALMLGFDDLEWQLGASKAAVVLTDAGFHEPDRTGGETLAQVEARSLEIDPVNVFPVVDVTGRYAELAARTSGEVVLNAGGDTEAALASALENIASRPSAVLSNATYTAAAGRPVHFDASGSTAVSGTLAQYDWDVDGDGFTDQTTTEPVLDHTYPPGYTGVMQVLVVDDSGRSANASAGVLVDEAPQRGVVPRVPGARSMLAEASNTEDGIDLEVRWEVGAEQPARWVVAVDGDPVDVRDGATRTSAVTIDHQTEPWKVTVTPMDSEGNLGPAYAARLEAMPGLAPWYRRPVVWGAALLAGVLSLGVLRLARRRPPREGAAHG